MADELLRVVEFYSGIGGMHFALKGKQSGPREAEMGIKLIIIFRM